MPDAINPNRILPWSDSDNDEDLLQSLNWISDDESSSFDEMPFPRPCLNQPLDSHYWSSDDESPAPRVRYWGTRKYEDTVTHGKDYLKKLYFMINTSRRICLAAQQLAWTALNIGCDSDTPFAAYGLSAPTVRFFGNNKYLDQARHTLQCNELSPNEANTVIDRACSRERTYFYQFMRTNGKPEYYFTQAAGTGKPFEATFPAP